MPNEPIQPPLAEEIDNDQDRVEGQDVHGEILDGVIAVGRAAIRARRQIASEVLGVVSRTLADANARDIEESETEVHSRPVRRASGIHHAVRDGLGELADTLNNVASRAAAPPRRSRTS